MKKLLNLEEFKGLIRESKNFAVTGFRWSGTPQLLLRSIREIFDLTGEPNGIKIIFTSSATDPGIDYLAHPDLLFCSYGSYYGSIPKVRRLVEQNLIKGYSLPQGQISLLFREIARGSPGLISSVGINTYVDAKFNGGKLNQLTTENAVDQIVIDGKRFLIYKSFKIDIGLIRGSIADKIGNISMENEPIKTEFLSMAQAVRSCGGRIYVQVAAESSSVLKPNDIDLPSHLVDGYIIANNIEKDHRHTNKYVENKYFLSNGNFTKYITVDNDPIYKKIIAKKALSFVNPKSNIILGQGLPEIVGVLARKKAEKYKNLLTFMESGVIGGIPERRPDFGVAFGPSAFLAQDSQFVGFNGGHIDMAILSFVEFDENGNINVSQLGKDYFGCGGYIDICHSVKTILFVGSFKAKNLVVNSNKDKLEIVSEGKIIKGVKKVKEVTFSPKAPDQKDKKIFIITERCVFSVKNEKVFIDEIYDGIDLKKDILNQMNFTPEISNSIIN